MWDSSNHPISFLDHQLILFVSFIKVSEFFFFWEKVFLFSLVKANFPQWNSAVGGPWMVAWFKESRSGPPAVCYTDRTDTFWTAMRQAAKQNRRRLSFTYHMSMINNNASYVCVVVGRANILDCLCGRSSPRRLFLAAKDNFSFFYQSFLALQEKEILFSWTFFSFLALHFPHTLSYILQDSRIHVLQT